MTLSEDVLDEIIEYNSFKLCKLENSSRICWILSHETMNKMNSCVMDFYLISSI